MPAEDVHGGDIPFRLRFDREKQAAEDKARTANDLRHPEDAVGDCWARMIHDARKTGEAGDPEDGSSDELHGRSPESDLMAIMGAEFVQCRKPGKRPPSSNPCLFVRVLSCLGRRQERTTVRMMMPTQVPVGLDSHDGLFGRIGGFLGGRLDCPAEAARLVLVDCFENEQNTAELEDRRADKGRDAAAGKDFVRKFGGRVFQRQPDEKGVDDPDSRSDRKDQSHPEENVPVGEGREHAKNPVGDGNRVDCFPGVRLACESRRSLVDGERMAAFPVIPRAPESFNARFLDGFLVQLRMRGQWKMRPCWIAKGQWTRDVG